MAHVEGLTLLDRSVLTGIVQRFPLNLQQVPLLGMFPRVTFAAGEIRWDIVTGNREAAKVVTRSASPNMVAPLGVGQGRATGYHIKEGMALTDEQQSLLRQPGTEVTDSQQRVVNSTLGQLLDRGRRRIHRSAAQCLSNGELSYPTADGQIVTMNYGWTTITSPDTSWDDEAADVLSDMALAIDAYTDTHGMLPNICFFNPKLVSQYLIKNEFIRDWMKRNSVSNAEFLADPRNMLGSIFTGVTFFPIAGQDRNDSGAIADRWPVEKITWARAQGLAIENAYWASERLAINNYTGQSVSWSHEPEDGRKGNVELYYADNGIHVVEDQTVVRPQTVIFGG